MATKVYICTLRITVQSLGYKSRIAIKKSKMLIRLKGLHLLMLICIGVWTIGKMLYGPMTLFLKLARICN